MRDLRARLREIVQSEPRELTYVPDLAGDQDLGATAARLGGSIHSVSSSSCVVLDRVWDADDWHGRRRVGSYTIDAAAPIGLLDSRLGAALAATGWTDRIVFFDLETTGLSGGAGTLPFLAGCGWFEGDSFRVRQFFLAGPAGERALLDGLAEILNAATLLVTFNGRTFDVPLIEMRLAFHRLHETLDGLPHLDMLPSARRFWRRREDDASCTLAALERSVLGFHRLADVPGFEIPTRYFHFLRVGDVSGLSGIFDHNRHDLLSLAAVASHALGLVADGPESCRDASEQLALGHLYDRSGDSERARRSFELASRGSGADVRRQALACLAIQLRRAGRHDEAARAWQRVLDLTEDSGRFTPLERRAAEALAIHHEHRARDLAAARSYARTLHGQTAGRAAADASHRLARIDRKLNVSGPLLD
jgi:uncharacterized protein